MNTSQDTPGFDATREALVLYCPTTPAAATTFLTTLQPRDFESLVTAARGGRNQEQTRALVLVTVAEIAARQALQIAALAGMGVGRLAAEHSVAGRPAEHVNQACELASKALDAAFEARVATKAALDAQDQAEQEAALKPVEVPPATVATMTSEEILQRMADSVGNLGDVPSITAEQAAELKKRFPEVFSPEPAPPPAAEAPVAPQPVAAEPPPAEPMAAAPIDDEPAAPIAEPQASVPEELEAPPAQPAAPETPAPAAESKPRKRPGLSG